MQSQQQPLQSDSLADSNSTIHPHDHLTLKASLTEPLFNQLHSSQNPQSHSMYNSIHEYNSDPDAQKLQQSGKINGFVPTSAGPFRASSGFSSTFTNNTRPRHHTTTLATGPYRDASNAFSHPYPTAADVFGASGPSLSNLSSPPLTQTQANPFDALHQGRGFDYNSNPSQPNGPLGKQTYGVVESAYGNGPSAALHQLGSKPGSGGIPTQHSSYAHPSATQASYVNGLHLQSQTPYGPHLQTNGPAPNGTATGSSAGQQGMTGATNGPNTANEEISTIFVVGFPEDMQEREFQNMFTFSQGFEAATLKIPNKEYTAYGSGASGAPPGSMRPSGGSMSLGYPQTYSGSNDPYNLVTVNQGGVVVDGGRDGTTASWPASVPSMQDDRDGTGHFGPGPSGQGMTIPPRKQIIGFAKFRSRNEALEARDILQGRRVDIEKGAVLKAEMAKKNLHTKRGVGPVPSVPLGGGSSGVGGGGIGMVPGEALAIAAGLGGTGLGMMGVSGTGSGETMSARERELGTLGAMGLGGLGQWREQRVSDGIVNREEEERERRREREAREAGVINAMGLGGGTRGPRERAEEDERERERRRKEKEGRLRSTNATAFDAFHSVPSQASSISRTNSGAVGGALSPSGNMENSEGVSPMMSNANAFMVQSQPEEISANENALAGPWDMVNLNGFRQHSAIITNLPPPRPPSSNRQSSPPLTNPSVTVSPTANNSNLPPHSNLPTRPGISPFTESQQQQAIQAPSSCSQPPSSASSATGGSQSSSDVEITRAIGGLAVSTSQGSTSPQLPSPASGSSTGKTNTIDQNPPINTLYVGNLPTTQMPSGYPPNYLEDSLRELFQRRPGFRKLCFRQKTNGPMCFVEFEDVTFASKTLNELYGNTLNGLIKGGGIRLSYSKNPLGVRTPTSAGTGPSLQQQQLQGSNPQPGASSAFPLDSFQPRSSMDVDRQPIMRSPPPSASYNYMVSQPPPRFFSPTPSSNAFGATPSVLANAPSSAFPRSSIPSQHGYTIPSNGAGTSTFSPFGLSTPPPQHSSAIHESITDATEHHFPHHRELTPSSIEAARAG